MAHLYTATGAAPGDPPLRWQDRKRWAWGLSVVYPLIPFIGLWAHHASGLQIALALPLLISYGLIPLLDALMGEDRNNPPEAVVPQLEADRYYRWLTWATVPLHFVALIGCAWWVGTQALSWWAVLLLAYIAGTDAGLGLNTAGWPRPRTTPVRAWARASTDLPCVSCPVAYAAHGNWSPSACAP